MRFLIFFIFLLTAYSQEHNHYTFRYKEGSFAIGDQLQLKLEGTTFYDKSNEVHAVTFVGMDLNTMTPLMISGESSGGKIDPMDTDYKCLKGKLGKSDTKFSSGTFSIKGNWTEAKIEGSCLNNTLNPWKFSAASIVKATDRFFGPEEAGLRARAFIGKDSGDFSASQVIIYSIIDYPYFTVRCEDFLTISFPDILYPEKGAIIVGKDGKHCGIINDKGTSFIHSQGTEKIQEIPLAMISRYFPLGVVYKKYPKVISELPSIKFYD